MASLTPALDRDGHYLNIVITGNSEEYNMPKYTIDHRIAVVQLSSITNGQVSLQYSLTPVASSDPVWHESNLGSVSVDTGISFSYPVTRLRVVAADTVSYRLEVLI